MGVTADNLRPLSRISDMANLCSPVLRKVNNAISISAGDPLKI